MRSFRKSCLPRLGPLAAGAAPEAFTDGARAVFTVVIVAPFSDEKVEPLDRRACDAAARSDHAFRFGGWGRRRVREAFRIVAGTAGRGVHAELDGELVGDESTILQRLPDRRQRSFDHRTRFRMLGPDLEADVTAVQH